MRSKERLTVTVDTGLIEAANEAVAKGRVASLSGWVNLALAERAAKERRLRTLAEAIATYEEARSCARWASLPFTTILPSAFAGDRRDVLSKFGVVDGPPVT